MIFYHMIIKTVLTFFVSTLVFMSCTNNKTVEGQDLPTYNGKDLGFSYSPNSTTFKIWSPIAEKMTLRLYEAGNGGDVLETIYMDKNDETGVWSTTVNKYLNKTYYTYQATVLGEVNDEVADPYAKAVGVNGMRSMVVNLEETNPEGWESDVRPELAQFNDIVLYELHVRDFSIHENSGIENKGKFLAFTEEGTTSPSGVKTGIDHLVDLGITHLHLLPSFDYRSIDETKLDDNNYNWGYDPQNYNVPEGSYSTDPYHGEVRIKEFKQMVQSLHKNGIRVVMDVVYNHTGATHDSNFDQLVPKYYYRQNEDGTYSDASACGNETASERVMVRKYIVESVEYWAKEYHIDGFRFDLMGIHDMETMEAVSEALMKIDPTIYVYGEGWAASSSPLPDSVRALKANTKQMSRIAAFSDDLRDGMKGHWSDEKDRGFVSGKAGMEESIKFGIVGSTNHQDIDYSKVNYSKEPWANEPWQTISYASCHDDHTLFDKLKVSTEAEDDEIARMHTLANTIVLTSQGVPFLHAGVDFLRTKGGDHNSYKSPDSVNALDWERKGYYSKIHGYYKDLIELRKKHKILRLGSKEQIERSISFLSSPEGVVSYVIKSVENDPEWNEVFVAFNGNAEDVSIEIPEGEWFISIEDHDIYSNDKTINGDGNYTIKGTSALLLHR